MVTDYNCGWCVSDDHDLIYSMLVNQTPGYLARPLLFFGQAKETSGFSYQRVVIWDN
jgi:hypothetical protein